MLRFATHCLHINIFCPANISTIITQISDQQILVIASWSCASVASVSSQYDIVMCFVLLLTLSAAKRCNGDGWTLNVRKTLIISTQFQTRYSDA